VPSSEGSVTEGAVSGAHEVPIQSGVTCWMDNSAGVNPVAATGVGKDCYIEDSHTVCAVAGATHNIVAGQVLEVDAARGVKIWIPAGGYTS